MNIEKIPNYKNPRFKNVPLFYLLSLPLTTNIYLFKPQAKHTYDTYEVQKNIENISHMTLSYFFCIVFTFAYYICIKIHHNTWIFFANSTYPLLYDVETWLHIVGSNVLDGI